MSPILRASLPSDVGVVIPAGGSGERAGGGTPKQFRDVAGIPMLLRSIRPFMQVESVHEVIIPLPAAFVDQPPPWLAELSGERLRLVEGGQSRAASVRNGVQALSASIETVLVHDAARPFVTRETVEAVIDVARRGAAAVAGVPATDTLKQVDERQHVEATIDRSTVWRAQTPQGFPRTLLQRAYDEGLAESGTETPTDEANLIERLGDPDIDIVMVMDSERNMKITTARDLELAEMIARSS